MGCHHYGVGGGHWAPINLADILREKFPRWLELQDKGRSGRELTAKEMTELLALNAEMDAAVFRKREGLPPIKP